MPKAPSALAAGPSTGSSPLGNALKRNQACHQCRKRKLHSNAQKPHCATCIRSHNIAKASSSVTAPAEPDCTYDEIPEHPPAAPIGPKAKFQLLESRINELEALLKEKEKTPATESPAAQPPPQSAPPSRAPSLNTFPLTPQTPNNVLPSNLSSLIDDPRIAFLLSSSNNNLADFSAQFRSSSAAPATTLSPTMNQTSSPHLSSASGSSPSLSTGNATSPFSANQNFNATQGSTPLSSDTPPMYYADFQMVSPSWPTTLPQPNLLHHLVDTFFAHFPHVSRMFHHQTFLASLAQPGSPEFPSLTVLHGICALASLYVPIEMLMDRAVRVGEALEVEDGMAQRVREMFGNRHAKYCERSQETCVELNGAKLLECVQATIMMGYYYFAQARCVILWVTTGKACRYCIPLGLNLRLDSKTLKSGGKVMSLLPPPSGSIEAEARINTWWAAYTLERFQAVSSSWAMAVDDEDISQILPIRMDDFEAGRTVLAQRETIATPSVLTVHPPVLTDSYTLYVKATILLSRVKIFTLRFRAPEGVTVADTPAFKSLESTILRFGLSFPKEYRSGIGRTPAGGVDTVLCIALLIPHVAMIHLHDPHAQLKEPNCRSSQKILHAARAILDQVYAIMSTSLDLTFVDHLSSFCWFTAAKVLIRYYKAKMVEGNFEEAEGFKSEVQVIKLALFRMGERVVIAFRQGSAIEDLLNGDPYNEDVGCQISDAFDPRYQPLGGSLDDDANVVDMAAISPTNGTGSSANGANGGIASMGHTPDTLSGSRSFARGRAAVVRCSGMQLDYQAVFAVAIAVAVPVARTGA
ncbi:hypothetical protein BOTBODRAFT_71140 [Botryobasidium botryosum FD-172 SS1]|uniref:Xylanolytic transcriptional activator regulatory domain-containing protein n=1 Tax=Botryobasidium botryosum (strain FD-172 SS1) TaxID=930990 RepID=A0A067LSC0_BOTB1|nr:hypothetical protein BOTBODRAFT_71140 [Botryobasidium botryosum FD-172 SS1]